MGILHNVYKPAVPPPPPTSHTVFPSPSPSPTHNSNKRKASASLFPDWRTKLRRREAMSFESSHRSRIVSLLPGKSTVKARQVVEQSKRIPLPPWKDPEVDRAQDRSVDLSCAQHLCAESGELPTLESLKALMTAVAESEGMEEGLESDDVVKLVGLGLKNYMLNHLTSIVRTNFPPIDDSIATHFNSNPEPPITITLPPPMNVSNATSTSPSKQPRPAAHVPNGNAISPEKRKGPPPPSYTSPTKPRSISTTNNPSPNRSSIPNSAVARPNDEPESKIPYISLQQALFPTELFPHSMTATYGGLLLREEALAMLDVFEGTVEEEVGGSRREGLPNGTGRAF
ncbi:hypothetical protein BC832DRAFT_125780 [Gaertneriomyces semiglobifer]|nr:hypothetical protein BC832DRAFT_125780 [Gaertneriomyces semiglobifer]